MAKNLVIVESPAKAKTIGSYLGKDYEVQASVGHIRDLPLNGSSLPKEIKAKWWSDYAVDVDNDFEPIYEVPSEKAQQVKRLKEALKGKDTLVLATDEDREGESISWHLLQVLKPAKSVAVKRIAFHEITKDAILKAIENPRAIDFNLVEAQETRRVLDRLFGYTLSPVLWSKILRNLSAGRVQTPAVKLLVERERARMRFKSASYWDVKATLTSGTGSFSAILKRVAGEKVANGSDFDDETGQLKTSNKESRLVLDEARAVATALAASGAKPWTVTKLTETEGVENPAPPFMTTSLQQEANRKFGFGADRTMRIAQSLYEGIELKGDQVGLITYMRTDSLSLAAEAVANLRGRIQAAFPDCLPEKPRTYTSKVRNAQEAHEAIRPTDAARTPESLRSVLSDDQWKIYDLIWKRAMASQMKPAKVARTDVEVTVKTTTEELAFGASGRQILFDGFLRLYRESNDEPDSESDGALPRLKEGQTLDCKECLPLGHATKPPARYTDATLIKKLEEKGIGRPSTYASIISVVLDRGYARKVGKQLIPTFKAFLTMDLLDGHFGEFTNLDFTRQMDETLDDISEGKANSKDYLRGFFQGEIGLKTLVDTRKASIPYPNFKVGEDPSSNEEIIVRLSKDGRPFLQRGPTEKKNYANVPEDLAPADLTVEKALSLFDTKAEELSIGVDPDSGRRLLLKNRQGYYLEVERTKEELEAKARPKWISVPPGIDPRELSKADLDGLCRLPRTIGTHPELGVPIEFKIGKYGAYVEAGSERRTVPDWRDGFTMTVDQAVEALKAPKFQVARKPIQALLELGQLEGAAGPVKVLSGRFGPYVTDGEVNATLPKGIDPALLTADEAVRLLTAKRDAGPARPKGRGRVAAKAKKPIKRAAPKAKK